MTFPRASGIIGHINPPLIGPISPMPPRPGRPRNHTLHRAAKFYLPAPLLARFDLLTMDPLTSRPKYGEQGAIVAQLLEAYLDTFSLVENTPRETVLPLPEAGHFRFVIDGRRLTLDEIRAALARRPAEC